MSRRASFAARPGRADGTTLRTLYDSATVLREKFATVTQWGALETAIRTAATTGKCDDIEVATEQVERVLYARRLI